MSKKRILLCGESTSISSGYANYGLQIMNRLHKTNEFELGEVAAFPKNQNAHLDVPWVVYSRDKSGNLLKDPKDIFVVEKDKRGFKEKNGINPNCLIIGTVMRNQ